MKKHFTLLSALALTTCMGINAQEVNNMVVQTNKIGAEIQPTMSRPTKSVLKYSLLCTDISSRT